MKKKRAAKASAPQSWTAPSRYGQSLSETELLLIDIEAEKTMRFNLSKMEDPGQRILASGFLLGMMGIVLEAHPFQPSLSISDPGMEIESSLGSWELKYALEQAEQEGLFLLGFYGKVVRSDLNQIDEGWLRFSHLRINDSGKFSSWIYAPQGWTKQNLEFIELDTED
jgi:hypothetical protein